MRTWVWKAAVVAWSINHAGLAAAQERSETVSVYEILVRAVGREHNAARLAVEEVTLLRDGRFDHRAGLVLPGTASEVEREFQRDPNVVYVRSHRKAAYETTRWSERLVLQLDPFDSPGPVDTHEVVANLPVGTEIQIGRSEPANRSERLAAIHTRHAAPVAPEDTILRVTRRDSTVPQGQAHFLHTTTRDVGGSRGFRGYRRSVSEMSSRIPIRPVSR